MIDVSGNDVIRTPVATINEQGGPFIGSTALSDQKIGWVQDLRSLGLFGRAWAVGVVLFSVARALLTWPTLSTYGVDPWVFLAIDVITAPPYGVGQALTVKILRDPSRHTRDATGWAALVVVMFLAPYIYILMASGERMPLAAYVLVALWALLFGTLAIVRMRKQVRADDNLA